MTFLIEVAIAAASPLHRQEVDACTSPYIGLLRGTSEVPWPMGDTCGCCGRRFAPFSPAGRRLQPSLQPTPSIKNGPSRLAKRPRNAQIRSSMRADVRDMRRASNQKLVPHGLVSSVAEASPAWAQTKVEWMGCCTTGLPPGRPLIQPQKKGQSHNRGIFFFFFFKGGDQQECNDQFYIYITLSVRSIYIEHALPARWLESLNLYEEKKGYASQYSILRKVFLLLSVPKCVLHQKITNNPAEPSFLLGENKGRERERVRRLARSLDAERRCQGEREGRARALVLSIYHHHGLFMVAGELAAGPIGSLLPASPNLPQPSIQALPLRRQALCFFYLPLLPFSLLTT